MSNVTTVLNLGTFAVNVGGLSLTCFPDTGALMSCAPLNDESTFTSGMNRCSAIIFKPNFAYEVTVNVLAHSSDHSKMDIRRRRSVDDGRALTFAASYGSAKWVSAAVAIVGNPTVTVQDGAEFVPYVLRGTFVVASVGIWLAPTSLGASDFE